MSDLSDDQSALKNTIRNKALVLGGLAGLAAGGIVYWLSGGLGQPINAIAGVVVGAGAAFFAFRGIASSGAKQAACEKCGATFSVNQTGRSEELLHSEEKSKLEDAVNSASAEDTPAKKLKPATTKSGMTIVNAEAADKDKPKLLTTWVEDTYEVTLVSTCKACGEQSTRAFRQVRERDKQTRKALANSVSAQ